MSATEPLTADLDLTSCDREAIHIPGAILPHGAMLVVDPTSLEIVQVAGDCTGLLGTASQELLSGGVDRLFTVDQLDRIRALVAAFDLKKPRHLLDPLLRVRPDFPLDVSVHRSGDVLIMEF